MKDSPIEFNPAHCSAAGGDTSSKMGEDKQFIKKAGETHVRSSALRVTRAPLRKTNFVYRLIVVLDAMKSS